MKPDRRNTRRAIFTKLAAISLIMISGCESKQKLQPPLTLTAPYERTQLWAVVPPFNESGTSGVRTDQIADAFAEQIEQVQNLNSVPVNRVIIAMRQMSLTSVTSQAEALSIMSALNVDGLLVGTVTAYDPYPPMKLGMAIQLFTREPSSTSSVDPVKLTRAPTELPAPAAMNPVQPVAQASGVFDNTNHETLMWVAEYAGGRHVPQSAFGEDAYLVSMDLYTQFVAYRLIFDLLTREQARVMPDHAQASASR